MKFCPKCDSFMKRTPDGYLRCSRGHIISDEVTKKIQKNIVKRIEKKKERIFKSVFSLLDGDEDTLVFRLINPFMERQRRGLTRNPESFKVYEELHSMEEEYPPEKFMYIRGDLWSDGPRELKGGYIICSKNIAYKVKNRIEKIKLKEGNYTLEQFKIPESEVQKLIKKLNSKFLLEAKRFSTLPTKEKISF